MIVIIIRRWRTLPFGVLLYLLYYQFEAGHAAVRGKAAVAVQLLQACGICDDPWRRLSRGSLPASVA